MSSARTATLLACALLCLALAGGHAAAAVPAPQAAARGYQATDSAVIHLLNQEREQRGLRALRRSDALDGSAQWQSHDMVARGYFDHQRPGGPSLTRRIRRTGYLNNARSWTIGENIAWGEGTLSTSKSIVAAWMESPDHRANILSREFRQIGIGVEPGDPEGAAGSDAVTVTTDFGGRR